LSRSFPLKICFLFDCDEQTGSMGCVFVFYVFYWKDSNGERKKESELESREQE
jgi:hypothetical protein